MTDLNELLGLAGTVSIVTGGGSGIGRACAELLARAGSSVCVVDRDAGAADETVRQIEASGGAAMSFVGDAREASIAQEAVRATGERFGRVDVLVNNVGGMFFAPAEELSANGWSAVLRLNLDTTFFFSQAAAPAMRERGKGAIVNIASVAGIYGSPRAAHYGAAKAAIINLTKTLALEWAPAIRVNAVAPDLIRTAGVAALVPEADQQRLQGDVPLERLGAPEDVANAVVFLASDLASFITAQTIVIDGGSGWLTRSDG
jgi:NAD(P)-dependent dehydrogenase (short-subunit alcohol dehydrogenase family)